MEMMAMAGGAVDGGSSRVVVASEERTTCWRREKGKHCPRRRRP